MDPNTNFIFLFVNINYNIILILLLNNGGINFPRFLKSIISFTLLSVHILLIFPSSVLAQTEQLGDVNIYFFWGDGCPHCEEEKPFLKSLVEKYPQLKLNDYEVWCDTTNQDVLRQFADLLGFSPQAVPITIIGDKYWIGFREEFLPEFETAIRNCLDSLCSEDVGAVVFSNPRQEEQLVQKSDLFTDKQD